MYFMHFRMETRCRAGMFKSSLLQNLQGAIRTPPCKMKEASLKKITSTADRHYWITLPKYKCKEFWPRQMTGHSFYIWDWLPTRGNQGFIFCFFLFSYPKLTTWASPRQAHSVFSCKETQGKQGSFYCLHLCPFWLLVRCSSADQELTECGSG